MGGSFFSIAANLRVMDLEAIPGVGEKTAEALAELEDPEHALEEGDVAALAEASGVTTGRAARIARAAIQQRHDDPGGFLATDRARETYREIVELLRDRTVTDHAGRRLETFYPSPARSRIEEARAITEGALEHEPTPDVRESLSGVEPLESAEGVRVRDRCIATTDAERYAEAKDAVPELSVEVVDDARELAELARGYATVIALDSSFAGIDVDGDVRVEPDALEDPASIVPERTLSFFAANRDRLQAALEVHRAAELDIPLDPEILEDALGRLGADGEPAGDDELDRLTDAVDDLDASVSTAESVATDRLRESIRERDVTVEGSDLLSLVEQGAGVDSLLQQELAEEYASAVEAARDHLVDALRLTRDETAIARRVFTDEPTFPVQRNEEAVSRLRDDLRATKERRATRIKRDLADDLAGLREDAETLVRNALDLDVELAIARFAREFDCTMPTFAWDVSADGDSTPDVGVAIEGGRSPVLDVDYADVESVDYGIDGVALLSGVNSGGKTSLLDLVALVVVLAHMGLPVPAEDLWLRRFESLHYHAKTQGTLDAGAFEATVREFAELAENGANSLVLVDELESITEPGASAKIIAGILERLHDNDATGVFVSHLAGEIRETTSYDVTVDGIEALGLEDGELKVNRSPVTDHLARSTPELIVEKLADDHDTDFYDELLEKFE
jgi:dsDNA-specific endonuclease/ATPase MutS2